MAGRTSKQLLLFSVLAGVLAGIHEYSTLNMKQMYRVLDASMSLSSLLLENDDDATKQDYPSRTDQVFYVPARGRRDRSGAAILDMLKAQAYSFQQGVAFGGACGDTPHRATNEAMIQAIGMDPALKYACPPPPADNNTTDGIQHVMITRNDFFHIPPQELFTKNWLHYIHTQVQPISKRWQDEGLFQQQQETNNHTTIISNYTIAVHIRRGDVDPCGHWSFRYLPNSHYLAMLDHYKRQAPRDRPTQCLVFSESHSLLETFDDFEKRGCQVILDGDPTVAWKAMLQADVVLQSLSSFSHVPSLLNPHGVIAFTPTLNEPLQSTWKWHMYKHSNQAWRYWIDRCDEYYGKKKQQTKQ